MAADPVALAAELLRCPSITPAEGGALAVLERVLKGAGFEVHHAIFAEPDTPPIDNLYARIGSSAPRLAFAGHTDVVPPGDETTWRHPPFAAAIDGGVLYGRGAVDMKGALACAVAASLDHLAARSGKPKGSIAFLITGDEEGIAVNGTVKLLQWAKERGENPVRGLVTLMAGLMAEPLDQGSANFGPSNLEFTSIDIGNTTVNLIPGQARARFNIRFNDCHSQVSLRMLIETRARQAAGDNVRWHIDWQPSNADSFVTTPGPFLDLVVGAITDITGRSPTLSTTGGTSDARFIKNYCPVLEFGLVGQTMHQVDERTPVADLTTLTAVYRRILDRYFA